jgi:hypothetical protein
VVLKRGLDSANNQPEFVKDLVKIMRQHIISSDDHPKDWFFPAEKGEISSNGERNGRRDAATLVLADMRMTNSKVRKVIEGFVLVIDAYVSGEEERANHNQCVKHYENMMQILTKHTEYTGEELTCSRTSPTSSC